MRYRTLQASFPSARRLCFGFPGPKRCFIRACVREHTQLKSRISQQFMLKTAKCRITFHL